MKLRENLELATNERLDELNLGFITNTFKSLKDKSADFIRNKVMSGWEKIKAVLADSKEKEEQFLDYLNYVFDKNFSSPEDVDMVLARIDEKVTWDGIKEFIRNNFMIIIGVVTIITEVTMDILKSANLTLAVLYLIISLAMLLVKESETEKALAIMKKKTEQYQADLKKLIKAGTAVQTAKKAVALAKK